MESQKSSSVKTRRSFSSHDPPSSSSTTIMPAIKSSLRQPVRRLVTIPPTISEQQQQEQQKQQFLDQLRRGGADLKSNSTVTESGEIVSISEFSIAPRPTAATNSVAKRKRSFSLNESAVSVAGSSTVNASTDSNLNQYINETTKWRMMRTQLKLPPEVRLKLEGRKPISFKNVALGVLDEVHVKHERINHKSRFEPTYQLGPKRHCNQVEVEKIVHDILSIFISNLDASNTETTMSMVQSSADHLTTLIKARVKMIVDKRYKIVVYAMVIDKQYQGVMVASKCLWDADNDVCITVREDYKNYSIIINIYAVYHE